MAKKSGVVASEEEMMRGAWDWACDEVREPGCQITVVLAPSERMSVWRVVAREHWVEEGRPLGIRRQASLEWPTATTQSLGARVFESIYSLENAPVQELLPWKAPKPA